MPRIVALDVGDATVGVAATDELGIAVHPIRTIRRGNSIKADVRCVEELLKELDASKIVVGIPLNLESEEGVQAAKVKEFTERLARRVRIPIEFWDERYSTVEAEEALLDMDISRKKRRKVIDEMAAVFILQSYLRSTEGNTQS